MNKRIIEMTINEEIIQLKKLRMQLVTCHEDIIYKMPMNIIQHSIDLKIDLDFYIRQLEELND